MILRNLASVNVIRAIAAVFFVACLIVPAAAQDNPSQPKGVPDDWSHHHLVFSNPGTFADAMKNGTYDQWARTVSDPRYQMQQMRRNAALQQKTSGTDGSLLGTEGDSAGAESGGQLYGRVRKPPPLHRDWSMTLGSGGSVGADQYPAKFSFSTTQASCDNATQPDFVVYNTGLASSGTQPSIIAYDNLYSGCSGAMHPLVYFQYNTITGNIAPTSVVLAEDGIQMAFIQRSGTTASLVILKSARNTVGTNATLVTLGNTGAASYHACTAPCMTVITLNGSPNVTYSAPFYDYARDVLYVGDDSGVLHKFQNIFVAGTPGEVTTGWPVNIDSAAGATDPLTSPVLDNTSGNVLVFISGTVDAAGAKLARVAATGGTVTVSGQLDNAGAGLGFTDGPLVDSTAGTVYGFLNYNVNSAAGVVQLTTTFSSGSFGTAQNLGLGSTLRVDYNGAFDNTYYTSGNPALPTGNIYACGRAAATSRPTMYQYPSPPM